MMITDSTAKGKLKISKEVVATIASVAALEVKGVAAMSVPAVVDAKSFQKIFLRNQTQKSVDIDLNGDVAEITLYIMVDYGAKVSDVAAAVQRNVKEAVQNMTAIAVSKVHVFINDVVRTEQ